MNLSENFKHYVFLILIIHATEGIKLETVKYCCGLGTNYADSGLKCKSFQPPIASVQKEDEPTCLNTIDMCCQNEYRIMQCNIGKNVARTTKSCQSYSGSESGDFQKDCCEACLLGQTGQPCQNTLGLGPPYDTAFMECCNEMTPTASASASASYPPTPPSSTTSSGSTNSSTTTTSTSRLDTKSLTPAVDPPLENPCDIGDICAQICIPTPDSYKCECYKGFKLMADGISCKPDKRSSSSDRCETNNPCEQECIDTGTAVKCACLDGFDLGKDKRSCLDIDECALKLDDCEENEVCVNGEGFYYCDSPDSPLTENQTTYGKCPEGFKFNGAKQVCDDIDECEIGLVCPRPQTCVNTIGSFTCESQPIQCPPGFHFKASTATCDDVDECVTGQDDCNRESQVCLNTKGNFTCIDKVSKKSCPPGFKKNAYTQNCEDVNECEEEEALCAPNEECVNEPGGHTCVLSGGIGRPTRVTVIPVIPVVPPAVVSSTTQATTSTVIATTTVVPTQPSLPPAVPDRPKYSPPNASWPYQVNPYPPRQPAPNTVVYARPNSQPVTCPRGFEYSSQYNRCEDVNECTRDYRVCDSNQDCYNTQGSYVCRCKAGFMSDVTGACADVNECQVGSHNCMDGQRCDNTIGSYLCSRTAGCGTGYTLNYANGLCEDDDECLLGSHNCNDLGPKFQCRNTLGSYRCERIRCTDCYVTRIYTTPARVQTPVMVQPTAVYPIISGQQKNCLQGYKMNGFGRCEDINECESNPCQKGEKCLNLNGRFQCIPLLQCKRGYELNEERDACVDINECARGLHKCTRSQMCENGPGYYTCQCPPGHKLNHLTSDCEDIDECKIYRGRICSVHADCINTVGSYKCECKTGYRNKGDSCEDINECDENNGLCQHTCVNTWGSYRCACKSGFTLNNDNSTCTDIDECEKFKDSKLCIGYCQNTPGSYTCKCPQGYRLGSDERVCQDVDECTQNPCTTEEVCVNKRGGYKCHAIQCPNGYFRDPDHKSRCKRVANVCDARDSQCFSMPQQYSYHFVTLVSNLPITQGRIPFFQMKGPDWNIASTEFAMNLGDVNCPRGVRQADESYFYLQRFQPNGMQLYLVKSIEGPQEIEIKVEMKLYVAGILNGVVVARIVIIVSEYSF